MASSPKCAEASLSPRFLSALLQGGAGEGLLVRAQNELTSRAFRNWQLRPWDGQEKNWLDAEQSLVRVTASEENSKHPEVNMEACEVEKGVDAVADERRGKDYRELQMQLQVERERATCLEARLQAAEMRAAALMSERHGQRSQHSTLEFGNVAENSLAHQALAVSGRSNTHTKVPKLAKLATLMQQSDGRNSNCSRPTSWRRNSVEQIPSLPAPLLEQYLMTPRTAATPRTPCIAEIPEKYTPRISNRLSTYNVSLTTSPDNTCSPSSSPTNSCSSLQDVFDDWGFAGSAEANNPPGFDVESERMPTSTRSNYSLCGLYGTGPEAESQVLRKIIRDLETQLERQSAELQVLRQKSATICT
eukprot:TRINITY_DN60697_c0_g1_i1.p1 TRINITY_DN60697_c0_g1~~TRINITY_DN60697_c0_g1_i1.p1  ORF type:complete len:361 (+),score=74.36 TRINITY_DN60697_c0_g1_i1:118-1200(+)